MAEAADWNVAQVATWLERRIAAARAEQAVSVRAGRGGEDDCDKASAEEMVCSLVRGERAIATQDGFVAALRALLDRDDYTWRGVNDDTRFDRHVRTYLRKLIKMARTNSGFENTRRYQ